MTTSDSSGRTAATFRERLVPGPWLFIALLLIVPSVMLAVTPLSPPLALPAAIAMYVIVAGSLLLMAPVVSVENGQLTAGRARIPAALLGTIEVLDSDALRAAIGPGTDARSHLVVRGYIHRGVRVEVVDPDDPAPYWIITSRRPKALQAAIEAAR
jgi:hypothetical protein